MFTPTDIKAEVSATADIIEEMFRYILQKDKNDRNLFEVNWIQKEFSSNSFFKKLIDQGDYSVSHQ